MADVAVAPSVWREPFSRSVIEPLACGIPVVATRIGGNPEILNGWLDGLLVEPGDHHELADRLLGLADWRSDDPTLGDRCRQAIVRRLDSITRWTPWRLRWPRWPAGRPPSS